MRRAISSLVRCLIVSGLGLAGCSLPAADAAGATATAASPVAIWQDTKRGRSVPVRIVAPAQGEESLPVLLFSHGLGGSVEGGTLWSSHWAAHGYLVIHLQHPGSDQALWESKRGEPAEAMKALKSGATGQQLVARIGDVKFVLDEIVRRKAEGDPLLRRADLARVGMSGHSFGSQTTLALVGQRFMRADSSEPMLLEPRIKAALALSPVARSRQGSYATQFGAIRIPVMSITGTRDGDVIGDGTVPADRTKPFEHMQPPGKYLAVFESGDHMVFGGHGLRRTPSARDLEIQEGVKALSLAFWDAHLKGDAKAAAWLAGDGARGALSKADRYEARP